MAGQVKFIQACAAAASVAALGLLGSASVFAQAATATPVVLACPTPTSTGLSANLSTTAPTHWETSGDGGAWTAALAYNYGNPWLNDVPGGDWIGGVSGPSFTSLGYRVPVDASDPNVDLASAKITYTYRVDNYVSGVTFNGTALGFDPTTSFNTPAPYTLAAPAAVTLTRNSSNLLTFQTTNGGNPWGLNAAVTLTYDCKAAVPPVAVPADAPWALLSLSALMLVGVGAARRRQRR